MAANGKRGCLRLDQIPGLQEAAAAARHTEVRTREDAWLDLTHDVGGLKIRTMNVRDFILLERIGSPFLYRRLPTLADVALFLWALSPAFDRWCEKTGWRKWLPSLQSLESFRHGRRVRKLLRFAELEKQIASHFKNPANADVKFEIADDSAFMRAVKQCFDYKDKLFFDQPAAMAAGRDSGLSYLCAWYDAIASEYPAFSDEEKFYRLPLPKLFSMLKAIQQRKYPAVPNFNRDRDRVNAQVLRAMRNGATIEDLMSGRIKFNN